MRITQGMITESFIRNLSYNLRRLGEKEDMLSSGKRVRIPSDDPVSAVLAMRLRGTLKSLEQYVNNDSDALTWLNNTESALANTGDILQRIRELTVYASNGALTAEDRKTILDEVTQLKLQLLQEANTSYNNRYLFGNYYTDKPPFYMDVDGSIKANSAFNLPQKAELINGGGTGITGEAVDLNNLGASVTVGEYKIVVSNYDGVSGTADIEIRDSLDNVVAKKTGVSINSDNQVIDGVSGPAWNFELDLGKNQITGNGTAVIKLTQDNIKYNLGRLNDIQVNVNGNELYTDIFKVVESIENDLLNDNISGLSSKLSDLDNCVDLVLKFRSQVGAKTNRLEATKARLESNNIDFTALLSKTEDIDFAKVVMELKMDESVYRAALAVGARIIQPTLVDFLK